jgi:CRP-like cAMP-binding protein
MRHHSPAHSREQEPLVAKPPALHLRASTSLPWLGGLSSGNVGDPSTRLLTDRQRHHLALIATRLRLATPTTVYSQGADATWVYFISEGVIKTFRDLPSGKRQVIVFLFPGDIFGMAQNGQYVNSARSVTPASLFRMRVDGLKELLRRDPEMNLKFLSKLTIELRKAQRQCVVLGRRDAAGRVAMFLNLLQTQTHGSSPQDTIQVPMSRSDIADYLSLTPEAVSRATAELAELGIARFDDRHTARILNRSRFKRLVAAL